MEKSYLQPSSPYSKMDKQCEQTFVVLARDVGFVRDRGLLILTGVLNSFNKLILTKKTACMRGPFELLNILCTRKQVCRSIVFTTTIRKAMETSQQFGNTETHLLDLQLQGVKATTGPCYCTLKSSPHIPQAVSPEDTGRL